MPFLLSSTRSVQQEIAYSHFVFYLQVIKLMQSFKSRELVTELFAWRHYYWFLTDNGIEYLRTYLNLPSEIVPATLKKSTRPLEKDGGRPPRRDYGDRPPRREGGFGGPRYMVISIYSTSYCIQHFNDTVHNVAMHHLPVSVLCTNALFRSRLCMLVLWTSCEYIRRHVCLHMASVMLTRGQ